MVHTTKASSRFDPDPVGAQRTSSVDPSDPKRISPDGHTIQRHHGILYEQNISCQGPSLSQLVVQPLTCNPSHHIVQGRDYGTTGHNLRLIGHDQCPARVPKSALDSDDFSADPAYYLHEVALRHDVQPFWEDGIAINRKDQRFARSTFVELTLGSQR